MATPASNEARELALVEKVEFRFALADTDAKFQTLLNTYLSPLLLKLGSEHASVRNKVISTCQHINTRIKPQNLRLPVAALLKQFKENQNSSLIRHFDLLYAQQGITRLLAAEQSELLPLLLSGISSSNFSAAQGPIMFHFLLRSLIQHRLPPRGSSEDEGLRTTMGISDADASYLSHWFGKLMLLKAPVGSKPDARVNPGLSANEISFLTMDGRPEAWNSSLDIGLNMTEAKIKVLALLSSGCFKEDERLFPVLLASSDPNSRISETAEDLLKRALTNANLEDRELIDRLFAIYFGSKASDTSQFVPAVSVRLRTRILGVLTRARLSSECNVNIVRLVEEDLLQDFMVAGDTSKTDRELSRLRAAIITFLTLTSRRASEAHLEAISIPVIQSLRLFVEQEAQETRSAEIRRVRGDCFEIIGLLAAANKRIILEGELELLKWMFQSLGEEADKELLVSIDQALSSILRCFQQSLAPATERTLTEVLLWNVKQQSRNQRNLRYASVRFANRCLPFENIVARWIDISVLGQTEEASHEAVEEAKMGLDPYRHSLSRSFDDLASSDARQSPLLFPEFKNLIEYIFWDQGTENVTEAHIYALIFCRQALMWNALNFQKRALELSTDWDRRLDIAVLDDAESRKAIRAEITHISDDSEGRNALMTLFNIALKAFTTDHIGAQQRRQAGALLVELCTLLPQPMLGFLASKSSDLQTAVLQNDSECRAAACQAYALLSARADAGDKKLEQSLDALSANVEIWKQGTGSQMNQASGAMTAIAGCISRRLYLKSGDEVADQRLRSILPVLFEILNNSSDDILLGGVFAALSHLCMFNAVTAAQITSYMELTTVLNKISTRARTGDEKAIATLGHISLVLGSDDETLKIVTEHVYKLHELKQAESQFAVGETLACIACGWESSALLSKLDLDGAPPLGMRRDGTLDRMLDQVFADSAQTKPSLRKASVLWLLCFIQFCGDRTEIQSSLRKLQAIFKRCLSDRDELIQESASRGLGLIYEKGSRDLKDDLVRDLVGSFSSDRVDTSMAGTITEDTQLFEPGALPTGEGQSVSTYKDIMSLASEVGDSSLVYRFMNLASSDALWSSRAAFGRFGLSNVLSDSSVDGYLANNPKIYPKLFRYRFDPTPKVRSAMNEIWTALVKDPTATLEKHFEAIIDDLLISILGREWRVRQASCAALSDLVQGRELQKINPYLERLWTLCSKVLDDIKGSVRQAAADLSRVLTGLVLRTLEADTASSSNANKMLESVIPFIFSPSGLESSAEAVQASSLKTLLEIVKKTKVTTLRPFVPELVENLLALFTGLESVVVNYLYLNASKYNIEESDIDNSRLQGVRNSPLMEAIDRCFDALDDETMSKLSIKLQSSMKAAVGMPSKVGCALVLVSLSTRRNFLFKPYTDVFLNVIPRFISDRNETVSQSYAAALGYVARGASESSIIKVSGIARRMYFEAEDEKARISSAEVVRSIAKYATDRFASLGSEFLPFVFFARHDDNAEVKKLFGEVWNDNTGGPRAASLYLEDITKMVNAHLASPRWTIKHAAALAISDLTIAVAAAQGTIAEANAKLIWPPFKQALSERTWEGKEKILVGFATFIEKASTEDLGIDGDVRKILVREAKRRHIVYQSFAMGCMADVAARRKDFNLHKEVCDVVEAIIEEHSLDVQEVDKMDVDKDAATRTDEASSTERLRSRGLDALLKSVNIYDDADEVTREVDRVLDLVTRLTKSSHISAQTQSTLFSAVKQFSSDLISRPSLLSGLDKVKITGGAFDDRLAMLLFQYDAVSESSRLARSDAALALAKLVSLTGHMTGSSLRKNLQSTLRDERSLAVKELLAAALRQLD